MLSPSRGFCYCLPVRLGALVVSFLACLGSAILAGITLQSLAKISERITATQAAGFYLTSVSWTSLALFSLIGFIAVILQHPLLLTIFTRFIIYHLPANLFCNLFFTIVLFSFYHDADVILRSPQCRRETPNASFCAASVRLQRMTWVYLWVLFPAVVAQTYAYIIIRRFIFVISGEWAMEKEYALEVQKKIQDKPQNRKRNTAITHSIGHRGRRRAKADLWFTMETSKVESEGSFLPSIPLSSMAFRSPPPGSPSISNASRGLPPPPRPRNAGPSKQSISSPLPLNSTSGKGKNELSDRLSRLDMDFSDPGPSTPSMPHAEELQPVSAPLPTQQDKPQWKRKARESKGKSRESKGKSRESEGSLFSGESTRALEGSLASPSILEEESS